MKHRLLLIILASLYFPRAEAQTFVQTDLEVGISVRASGVRHHKTGTVDCNPFGRSPDVEHFNAGPQAGKSKASNARVEDASKTLSYPITINYADAHWIRARVLNVDIQNTTDNEGRKTVSVTLNDSIKKTQNNTNRGDCSHTNWVAKSEKDVLNGNIRIGYTMPPHVWAVKVTRVERTGSFASAEDSGVVNNLNPQADPHRVGKPFIVWAIPGTDIYHEVKFKNLTTGDGASGTLTVVFEPVAQDYLSDGIRDRSEIRPTRIETGNAGKLLTILNAAIRNYNRNPVTADTLFKNLVSLVARPDVLKDLATNNPTYAINQLALDLAQIANAGRIGNMAQDVQFAAAILGFEVGLRLLEDVAPYCDTHTIELFTTGEKVTTSGLRMAHAYLSRAMSRIENYRFSHYKAYLDQLSEYERAGLSYSDVRNDSKKLKQLQTALKALQTAIGSKITPFGAALNDLNFILSKFKAVGASKSSTDMIRSYLVELSKEEHAFISDFVYRLRAFRPGNNNVVQVQDLQDRLDAIIEKQEELLFLMKTNVRFLSLDNNADTTSFTAMMERVIAENIAIFEKPLLWNDFEEIRKSYLNSDKVTSVLQQASKCLMDGVER